MRSSFHFSFSFWVIAAFIAAAALSRIIPLAPNVAPVAAMALFAGAYVNKRALAFLVPLFAMFLSDAIIGFHSGMLMVYGAMMLSVLIGAQLKNNISAGRVVVASVASSLLFFIITNFALFYPVSMYPHTLEGVYAAYVAGIPFFRNSLMGDLAFSGLLFGGYALLRRNFPALRAA